VAVAASKLKAGGLLYVSYNAQPGWAAVEPLRRLLLDTSTGVEGDSLARARRGVAAAHRLFQGGAAYFAKNPAAEEMLGTMARGGLPYVVHEYFQPHWCPLYFADVAAAMAAQGLEFVGQLPICRNVRELVLPPALAPLFDEITDPLVFESLKDYATNEFFRVDLYAKTPRPRDTITTHTYLDSTCLGTTVRADRVEREAKFGERRLSFAGPLFDVLIPILANGGATIPELARRPELETFGHDAVRAAVLQLVFADQVVPMAPRGLRSETGRPTVVHPFNRMILSERLSSKTPPVLASPSAGTGIELTPLQAIALRLLTEVEPSARAAWVRSLLDRESIALSAKGLRIEDKDGQTRVILEEFERFRLRDVPKLAELGIVAL
jgi:hypothetical protein